MSNKWIQPIKVVGLVALWILLWRGLFIVLEPVVFEASMRSIISGAIGFMACLLIATEVGV